MAEFRLMVKPDPQQRRQREMRRYMSEEGLDVGLEFRGDFKVGDSEPSDSKGKQKG